ncbi:hypothetical protein Huta_2165 [Halorhabdus utahensis DSM 12940]|uniref:DUF2178 domain-containing protein n=1 Tax=Halorhabdus utahensis (strain DSM 12940 / JCM 11049 / AX-2) TaxID=519442 RepID=C7NUH5_HALUD|nr:DUF2178 domain-containing protein [Halorhabdus utahensis]ACV12332.1 hypothetical protein Huta_2165 [Halorhabdus utahensis DSM 12940]
MSGFLERPSRIRRVVAGLTVVGAVALAGFTVLERPLVGVTVFGLAITGVMVAMYRTERPVFDERDEQISREAAEWTLSLLGISSMLVFPTLTFAWGVDKFEWQPWSTAIAMFVAVLYLIYGAFLVVLRSQR